MIKQQTQEYTKLITTARGNLFGPTIQLVTTGLLQDQSCSNQNVAFYFQFDDVSLYSALWLLDKADVSSVARSSPIQISRTISAMVSETTELTTDLTPLTLPFEQGVITDC